MRKIYTILLVFIMSFCFLTACKKEVEVSESLNEEVEETVHYTFAYSCIDMGNPFFQSLEFHLRTVLEAQGHTLLMADAKSDAILQGEQIQQFIEQKVDAVFLSPVDWIQITSSIDALNEAGIKIINVDTEVQALENVDAFVGSDNTEAGYLCGEDLVMKFPMGGKIIIVECTNRNSINERIKGFEKAVAKKGFEVVTRIDAKGDITTVLPQLEEAIRSNLDVVAIMCGDDPMALKVEKVARTAGLQQGIVYGIDGSPEMKQRLNDEQTLIAATVGQSTETMALEAAEIAIKILNGEKHERRTYIETVLIDKENISMYGIDTWQ